MKGTKVMVEKNREDAVRDLSCGRELMERECEVPQMRRQTRRLEEA